MHNYQKPLLALALALSVGSVYAQTGGDSGSTGGGKTASTGTFQTWLNAHGGENNGRVSRQVYMDEAGRRWDSMDKNKQGLTLVEINGMYSSGGAMGGPTAISPNEKKGITQ